jgi:hypothetical protein
MDSCNLCAEGADVRDPRTGLLWCVGHAMDLRAVGEGIQGPENLTERYTKAVRDQDDRFCVRNFHRRTL